MSVKKNLTGVAVFVLALVAAVVVTHFYSQPSVPVPPAVTTPPPAFPPAARTPPPAPAFHKASLVSLDFARKKSYTTLALERDPSRPAPERLWVWTYFFAPDAAGRKHWAGEPVEVREPFAGGDRATVTVTAACAWCGDSSAPTRGYYARVNVSAESGDAARPGADSLD
ncbi:MAG: hypothetical protein ACRD68_06575, partial [Pyrinomonadaceae bacterium]